MQLKRILKSEVFYNFYRLNCASSVSNYRVNRRTKALTHEQPDIQTNSMILLRFSKLLSEVHRYIQKHFVTVRNISLQSGTFHYSQQYSATIRNIALHVK